MQIRSAKPDDLGKVAALYVINHRETYRGLLPEAYFTGLTEEYAKEKWAGFREQPGNQLWAAYEGDAFLGFAAGRQDPELPDAWYLDSLHVVQTARGKGIGSALIQINGSYARKNGYARMSICIIRGNEQARDLYQKRGAEHFSFFDDDFCGSVSHSEKLIWKDLNVFE